MLYVDTSVLVTALTNEADTSRIQLWLSEQRAGSLAVTGWVATEFSSALSIKVRTGHLDAGHRARILSAFARLNAASFVTFEIISHDFDIAARFVDKHETGLRAGDALHLAVASRHGATVCTLDRRLADAAVELGVDARLL